MIRPARLAISSDKGSLIGSKYSLETDTDGHIDPQSHLIRNGR
jgi:hypothetical protein